jgi:sugar-specific transcriptional regulator TrmB
MIEQLLQQLGLNEKEITVYLEIVKQGKITPSLIARKTSIQRSTVYAVSKNLIDKGLIFEDLGQKITHFVAKPIEELEGLYDAEKRALEQKKKLVGQAIAELEKYPKDVRYSIPKIRFIDEDGLENFLHKQLIIWNESAKLKDNSCWGFQDHSFAENYQKWINWAWKTFQMDVNLLSNQSEIENKLKNEMPDKRIIKFWEENVNFSSSMWIMGNYIIMITTRQEPFYAVEIYDAVLAHNLREVFKQIWKSLK